MTNAAWRFPEGRSRGVTVAVDGFFAFVWFGWGAPNAIVGRSMAVPPGYG